MIRDPSDGSVREEIPLERYQSALTAPKVELGIPVSGLRAPSQKPAVQARLERSREWLKTYFERKGQA